MVQGFLVQSAFLLEVLQQGLDFRSKSDSPVMHRIVERFDTDAVANQPKFTPARVPEGDRKHPAKALNAVDAPLFERLQDDLSIRVVGLPLVAAYPLQFSANLRVVVNLTIERDPQRAILIAHGLRSCGREIDDRQPPMSQAHPPVRRNPGTRAVRAAVGKGFGQAFQV